MSIFRRIVVDRRPAKPTFSIGSGGTMTLRWPDPALRPSLCSLSSPPAPFKKSLTTWVPANPGMTTIAPIVADATEAWIRARRRVRTACLMNRHSRRVSIAGSRRPRSIPIPWVPPRPEARTRREGQELHHRHRSPIPTPILRIRAAETPVATGIAASLLAVGMTDVFPGA